MTKFIDPQYLVEMTKTELRNYVLAHREDEAALYIYLDRVSAESPKSRIYSPTENVADAIAEYIDTQSVKEI